MFRERLRDGHNGHPEHIRYRVCERDSGQGCMRYIGEIICVTENEGYACMLYTLLVTSGLKKADEICVDQINTYQEKKDI